MWISKRKWNEMERRVNDLEKEDEKIFYLSREVERLRNAHITNKVTSYVDEAGKVHYTTKYPYYDNTNRASTSNIKDITLEELARLVIDHEPIVREENVKVKVEYR